MDRLRHTRLQSSLVLGVDIAEGLFPQEEPRPVVGPVPMPWRRFLQPRHLNEYYARIARCVAEPVETETHLGLRRIAALGTAVFEIDANGFVRTYLWGWKNGEFGCFAAREDAVRIGDNPHRWRWLERFQQGFEAELAWRLHCKQTELHEYSKWLFKRVRRKLQRECDLRHMREQVRAALALDPLAVQVARRIRLACEPQVLATLRDYNHAITHLAAYRKLQKEAPNLVPLYAAHADEVARHGAGEPSSLA